MDARPGSTGSDATLGHPAAWLTTAAWAAVAMAMSTMGVLGRADAGVEGDLKTALEVEDWLLRFAIGTTGEELKERTRSNGCVAVWLLARSRMESMVKVSGEALRPGWEGKDEGDGDVVAENELGKRLDKDEVSTHLPTKSSESLSWNVSS